MSPNSRPPTQTLLLLTLVFVEASREPIPLFTSPSDRDSPVSFLSTFRPRDKISPLFDVQQMEFSLVPCGWYLSQYIQESSSVGLEGI